MEYELYDGTVRLWFQEQSHRYQVSVKEGKSWSNPRKVVGVSTILGTLNKPSLMTWPMVEALKHMGCQLKHINQRFEWFVPKDLIINQDLVRAAAKAYTRKSDAGKDSGKNIHALIEKFSKGEPAESEVSSEQRAVESFARWFNESGAKVVELEKVLYSRKWDFAGTTDFVYQIGERLVLGDLKTTNVSKDAPEGIYPEAILQCGAYSLAYTEMTGRTIDDLLVVNISKKDGKVSTLYSSQLGWNVSDAERAFRDLLNVYRFHSRTFNYIKRGIRI